MVVSGGAAAAETMRHSSVIRLRLACPSGLAGRNRRQGAAWHLAALTLAGLSVGSVSASAQEGRDPRLEWSTLSDDHFEVHYHAPLEDDARRVLSLAQQSRRAIGRWLKHTPKDTTHIVLSDVSDEANGSAQGIPYNRIRLFATAPPDLSPLDSYNEWLSLLVSHEYVHIVQLDTYSRLAQIINTLFFRAYLPNQFLPRWFIEGLAVYGESAFDGRGRLRSNLFDMYLRGAVLEDRLLDLDTLSNIVDSWPQGTSWYLYGAYFVDFIADTYGAGSLERFVHNYGGQPLPYALNRTLREETGGDFEQLYPRFQLALSQRIRRELNQGAALGWHEGTRITHHGQRLTHPRFAGQTLYYGTVSATGSPGLYRLSADKPVRVKRTLSPPQVAADPMRLRYYSVASGVRHLHRFGDIFEVDRHGKAQRITQGLRASEPAYNPHSDRVYAVANAAGTRHLLRMNPARPEALNGALTLPPTLQVYTPTISPDGKLLAFSAWERGGQRDLFLQKLETGQLERLTEDTASDRHPVFSADGRWLYFSSDREGFPDIHALELATGRRFQVTRVRTGAFYPAPSPDGELLYYVGYTADGFDLFRLPLEDAAWHEVPAGPRQLALPSSGLATSGRDEGAEPQPYQPGRHLWPRSYGLAFEDRGSGDEIAVTFDGTDPATFITVDARVGFPLAFATANVDLGASYNHALMPVSLRATRQERRRNNLVVAEARRDYQETRTAVSLATALPLIDNYRRHVFRGGASLTQIDRAEPLRIPLDPNVQPPRLPFFGWFTRFSLGYAYSDTFRGPLDISRAEGQEASLDMVLADPLSRLVDRTLLLRWRYRRFWRMPWAPLHVFALGYDGGTSFGARSSANSLSLGGYPDIDLVDNFLDNEQLIGVRLRGFRPFAFGGRHLHVASAEYRFSLWRAQGGYATLPFYLARTALVAFTDVGHAFERFSDFAPKVGSGAELLAAFHIGYTEPVNLRLGAAYGFGPLGLYQLYANLGIPF